MYFVLRSYIVPFSLSTRIVVWLLHRLRSPRLPLPILGILLLVSIPRYPYNRLLLAAFRSLRVSRSYLLSTERGRGASLTGRVRPAVRLLWVLVPLSGAYYSPRPLRARDTASQVGVTGRAKLIAVDADRFGYDLSLRGAFCDSKAGLLGCQVYWLFY